MLRFVVFLAFLAAVVYAFFWILERRNQGRGGKGTRPIPKGPVGPDDDEAFLRELEWEQRHKRRSHDEET